MPVFLIRLLFLLSILLMLFSRSLAQTGRYTISGTISDAATGERLIGATVISNFPSRPTNAGTASNTYGFYSLSLPADSVTLTVNYVGFLTRQVSFFLSRDTLLNLSLVSNTQLEEIVIKSRSPGENLTGSGASRMDIPLSMVRKAPALLGEADLLKIIATLPGVQGGNEGSAGLSVRGGSVDQNLILLDGVPVYNVYHVFGFFSVFNPASIAHTDFIKGGIPARYGGRLSSVIDITLKEGNLKKMAGEFQVSPIAGGFTLEGPLKKEKASYMISARRTWIDLLSRPFTKLSSGGMQSMGYNFYDLAAKVNYRFSAKSRLYASLYSGRDAMVNHFDFDSEPYRFSLRWGNLTGSLRWNYVMSPRLFSNHTLSYSRYDFAQINVFESPQSSYYSRVGSGISDVSLKGDYEYRPHPSHTLRFGYQMSRQRFTPDIRQIRDATQDSSLTQATGIYATPLSVYLEDEFSLGARLSANLGLHGAAFRVADKWYPTLQPRVSARYLMGESSAVKASYSHLVQYLHLVSNTSLGLPTDLWVPPTQAIAPQTSHQLAIGWAHEFKDVELSLEAYYKRMHNVQEYKSGTSFLYGDEQSWEQKLTSGMGRAYGAEVMLRKNSGALTGWLSYTLSRSERIFAQFNSGNPFPYRYDRPHNLSMVASYALTAQKSMSANFTLQSGSTLTMPAAHFEGVLPPQATTSGYMDEYYYQYFRTQADVAQRNNYRMPMHHRLDLSYRTRKVKRHGVRSWIISVYNVYNRRNAFFLFYEKNTLKQFSLFPIIPSLAYQYEF